MHDEPPETLKPNEVNRRKEEDELSENLNRKRRRRPITSVLLWCNIGLVGLLVFIQTKQADSESFSVIEYEAQPQQSATSKESDDWDPLAFTSVFEKYFEEHRSQEEIFHQATEAEQTFPFYTIEKEWNAENTEYDFFRVGMHGTEVPLRVDARRNFISENQADYPEPRSGCGPTALLNLYIWYTKFGLLEESVRYADVEKYKREKFGQIDALISKIQQESRSASGGTNGLAALVTIDQLVQQHAVRPTRLHFEIKAAPLTNKDFRKLTSGYRVGLLEVVPKDKKRGKLLSDHMVLCIRGDNSGIITIANWGKFTHGRLVNRQDGQWFVPSNSDDHELRIRQLTTLIPFYPTGDWNKG